MNTLNKLSVLAALLFAIAAPSYASTPITSCTTTFNITASGTYQLQNDLTSNNSTPCLYITNANDVYTNAVEIDCNGHSITTSGGVLNYPIRATSNTAPIWWHDCAFTSQASQVLIEYSGTTSGGWVYGYNNTYTGTRMTVANSRVYTSYLETFTSTSSGWAPVEVVSTDSATIEYATVDLTAYTAASYSPYGIEIRDSDYSQILYSNVYSSTPTFVFPTYTQSNADDGILLACTHSASSPCVSAVVAGNTINYPWDASVELTGPWDYVYIHDNYLNYSAAAVAGYGGYSFSMSNSIIGDNAITHYTDPFGAKTSLALFTGDNTASSFFTNNTISGNSIDNSDSSYFGSNAFSWSTVSGNTVSGNYFGSTAVVTFHSNTGFSGGTSDNYCYSTVPSSGPFTCH